jgi:hypothetical protein
MRTRLAPHCDARALAKVIWLSFVFQSPLVLVLPSFVQCSKPSLLASQQGRNRLAPILPGGVVGQAGGWLVANTAESPIKYGQGIMRREGGLWQVAT